MAATAKLIDFLASGMGDSNGDPLSGYQVRTYASDGTTAAAIWEDRAKTLPSSAGKTSFSLSTTGAAEVFGDGVYVIKIWTSTADPDVDNPYDTIGPNSYQVGGSAFDGDASDISILDVGGLITATDVDSALTENRTALNLNTTHRTSNGTDHTYIDQDVTSGASPTLDNTNIDGTAVAKGNVSGAVTFDCSAGLVQVCTATGNITSISFSNQPTGTWEMIIRATNWGDYTVTTGTNEIPGGAITFTSAGVDKIVVSDDGTGISMNVAQADIQTA